MGETEQISETFAEMFRRHKGDPEIVDGRKSYVIRCKSGEVRMRLPLNRSAGVAIKAALPVEGEQTRAVGTVADPTDGQLMIEGTASSTSEDWYGTEMSPACLLGMQAQFNAGIGLYPSHGTWMQGLEWDDELGKTTEATIETMAQPPEGDDPEMGPGYCLRIKGGLDAENPKCQELGRRLSRGQKIGMSIGGWFTEVRYIMDEDEMEIERIIVEKVELDHLAIVRNPANPDCVDLKLLRSVASAALRAEKPQSRAVVPPAMSTREEPAAEPVAEAASEPVVEPVVDAVSTTEDPGNTESANTETEQTPSNEGANSENSDVAAERGTGEITNTTERQMDEAAVRKIVEEERAKAGLAEKELAELRASNANLRARLDQGERRGMQTLMQNHRRVNPSSFDGLCERSIKDLPHSAELVGIIRSRSKGLELVGRTKIAPGKDAEAFRSFCEDAPDFLREILGESGETGQLDEWRREMIALTA